MRLPRPPHARRSSGWAAGLRSLLLGVLLLPGFHAVAQPAPDTLAVAFDARRGQVEVGGAYAGVEFHGGRPLPSRISFYAPLANSLDLSTDYWQRGDSRPLSISVTTAGHTDTLGTSGWAYDWTPYRVVFHDSLPGYHASLSYQFAETLPIVVLQLTLRNTGAAAALFRVQTRLTPVLRTSHAYRTRRPDRVAYADDGSAFVAHFDAADTGPATLFVANAGASPLASSPADTIAAFGYEAFLAPGDTLVVTQLIGTAWQDEQERVRQQAEQTWAHQVTAYEDNIRRAVGAHAFQIDDEVLQQTNRLARALLRADRHYLDGEIVPMPSPAEYNFFFTHDLLVTDLGAVHFDLPRVRDDLRYVQSLVQADSVLPHARYWRDSTFVVEPANADNWNHLWAVLVTASYLHHSGDTATAGHLYPTLEKSMALMRAHERDGLMHAERPDWWDIGHVYGARAYLTALTIRALDAFAYLTVALDRDFSSLPSYADLAARMRTALTERLWDDAAGYLLNERDTTAIDRHYYSGSLLATAFGLLDPARRDTQLATARRELLDPQVGIRNAMPPDFHLLRDQYHFLEGEVGAPYLYMNGGVWPQGNAWYALALLAADRPDEARDVLTRYLSVAGVQASPNGQPAFYEYRNADPASPAYGAVDKPTFLWAGGWYLHVLYGLAGVRETPWSLSFSPYVAQGFEEATYDLALAGQMARVSWSGTGRTFRRITVDGVEVPSAVVTGPASRIHLERGVPRAPYLAAASGLVEQVQAAAGGGLVVHVRGFTGQQIDLDVVAPEALRTATLNAALLPATATQVDALDGAVQTRVSFTLSTERGVLTIRP